MKMLFLGLSAVVLLAAATPAGACFHRAGYAAAAGTHYYRPYRHYRHYAYYRGIALTFAIAQRAASHTTDIGRYGPLLRSQPDVMGAAVAVHGSSGRRAA